MELLVVVLLVGGFLYWIQKSKQSNNQVNVNSSQPSADDESNNVVSDEDVIKATEKFETSMIEDRMLPDAIGRRQMYLYRELMRPWFDKLSAKHRYNADMLQKIRHDWLQYLWSLKEANSSKYLWLELEADEETKEGYRKESVIERTKADAIEEGFAAAIEDPEAISKLNKAREIEWDVLDEYGRIVNEKD